MAFVFDTSSFIVTSHYFPDRFPTFWERLNQSVASGTIISVREVYRELTRGNAKEHLELWIEENKDVFRDPTPEEAGFVRDIFAVPRFGELVRKKQLLEGTAVADPFVIASARACSGCVVTEEAIREDAVRIPGVCEYFGIECTNMEGFMRLQGWTF